jgi:hypothetical protein
MAKTATRLISIIAAIGGMTTMLGSNSASAQSGINPQCAKMRDPVGCTCALENGGWIMGNGDWRYQSRLRESWLACKRRYGRT